MEESYRLERFVEAQNAGGTYQRACEEIRRGSKDTHWIWFVFPQLAGLGSSAMSREYSIRSLDEARAYLEHPVLGPRLRDITSAANSHVAKSAHDIFRYDDVKFHSSMTLFARASNDTLFQRALDQFFAGEADARTETLLAQSGPSTIVEE